MKQPYIGITGFMSRNEIQSVLDSMPKDSNRLLMVGVLASLKTVRGEQNKWPNRYPRVGHIGNIFFRDSRALNLIHYNTKEPESLAEQLDEMTVLGGPNLDGFQLNLAWPSYKAISDHQREWDSIIVLQIGGRAFEMVNHSPQELAERVSAYENVVDYVLLDPSGGYGVPFDTDKARGAYLEALKAKNLNLGLGVAGGLSPTTLNLIQPLLSDFPDLSIDAEGRLRDSTDNLDLSVASQYVQGACSLMNQAVR